jgi:tripartite ATP-independent transporter DctP family solute receptor
MKLCFKNLNGFLLALIVCLILMGCQSQQVRVLKLAHSLDLKHSVHQAMVMMNQELFQISDGKMQIKIYPSQQLGTERECLELLQIGSLDMTKVSVGVMENFAPKMKVLGLPFLFRDRTHSFEVLDGPIGKEILDDGKKYLLKGLGYYDAGSRSFYTKDKMIHSPEDLKGMKIRVMESITAMDMVRSLGGSPTPISWGELYTALQQGVVDGAENNPPSFYLSGHFEVCKYYALNEHTFLPDVVVISKGTWESLNDQERLWLEEAMKRSVAYQRILWQESEQQALDALLEEGVEIIRPNKQAFQAKVQGVYEQYKGTELYRLIEEIQNFESSQNEK